MNEWKRLFSFVREEVECVLSKSFYNVDRGVTMCGKEGTIPRASNHYMEVVKLRGWRKISTISQVVSSVQYICFRKTSWFEHGAPNFLLAPGTI